MKYLWNKTKLLDFINEWVKLTWLERWVFFDAFSWTSSVWKYFKEIWFNIISNDLMYYSYVEQKAYIENNKIPEFTKLIRFLEISFNSDNLSQILDYLNNIDWVDWFIYKNYCPWGSKIYWTNVRQYFNDFNWRKIDAVRLTIEDWNNQGLLNEYEYYILLSFLLNEADYLANISWTYGAYLKIWRPVATNCFNLRKKDLVLSNKIHQVHNENTNALIKKLEKVDITYLDIPYNHRQYSSNFHILETIAKYDNPKIKGITWQREDSKDKSSNYCKKRLVLKEFEDLILNLNTNYILFSYSSDGLMSFDEIKLIFDKYCNEIKVLKKDYRRFKTDSSRKYKNDWKDLIEYLFVYKK